MNDKRKRIKDLPNEVQMHELMPMYMRGKGRRGTQTLVSTLIRNLKRDMDHVGAHPHLYKEGWLRRLADFWEVVEGDEGRLRRVEAAIRGARGMVSARHRVRELEATSAALRERMAKMGAAPAAPS